MTVPTQRVFTPGDGAVPPALTGREREKEVLLGCLADLAGGRAPPHNVVLTGPRGNGKTALLHWFERACRERGKGVELVRVTPADVPNREDLVDVLAPPAGLARLLPRKLGLAAVGSVEWASPQRTARTLTARLAARCRRRPLAVLLDEAHTLDPATGRTLLNASQQVRAEAPFLLVLAGTPGLPAHLDAMNASFWSRLAGGCLGIGRLSDEAARNALVEPLKKYGVRVDPEPLDTVVESSQRYPYFIQIWGESLWKQHAATGAARLTAAHVAAARPAVTARVTDYYRNRWRELEAGELLPAAVATARLFRAGADAAASDHQIDESLAATGADAAGRRAAREALHRLGYFWAPPGQSPPVTWVAGIPSLMTYVLDHAPPAPGGRAAGNGPFP